MSVVNTLNSTESSFRSTGLDCNNRKFILSPATFSTQPSYSSPIEYVDIVQCTPQDGDSSFYYKQIEGKQRIVLHFTAGQLKGDIATLTTRNYHVSVPFVVARDGTIYNLWNQHYWAYHLGISGSTNDSMNRSSLGIEISNFGPLILDSINQTLTTTGKVKATYCLRSETQYYKSCAFNGWSYYATYTDRQYTSLIKLLRYLTSTHKIPRQFLGESERYKFLTDFYKTGIFSHLNYNREKSDIGPTPFDWDRVIRGVTASSPPA